MMNDTTFIDAVRQQQYLYNLLMFSVWKSYQIMTDKPEVDICSFLKKPKENPWHKITKQNEQYEWEI